MKMSKDRKTLLTPSEVTRFTPLKLSFNACSFRELYSIEYSEARGCIGFDLWKAMVAALAEYPDAAAYEIGTEYPVGSVVKFGGAYRIAKVATDRQPDVATDWEAAPKFSGDCAEVYDDFYCLHLAPYLSFTVLSRRFQYIVGQITDGGLWYAGKQYNAQDEKLLNGLKTAIFRDRAEALDNLEHYLSDQSTAHPTCYAGWKGIKVDECGCKRATCETCTPKLQNPGRYEFA